MEDAFLYAEKLKTDDDNNDGGGGDVGAAIEATFQAKRGKRPKQK